MYDDDRENNTNLFVPTNLPPEKRQKRKKPHFGSCYHRSSHKIFSIEFYTLNEYSCFLDHEYDEQQHPRCHQHSNTSACNNGRKRPFFPRADGGFPTTFHATAARHDP
jgi:hypothetical protein